MSPIKNRSSGCRTAVCVALTNQNASCDAIPHRVYAFDIQITVTALSETDTVTGVPALSLNT
ncbi:hypothetical protein ACU6HE_003462, partial [Escherichia coli]